MDAKRPVHFLIILYVSFSFYFLYPSNLIFSAESRLPVAPYEKASWCVPGNKIDDYVFSKIRDKGLEPAFPCSDEVFIRRIYLDTSGMLPSPEIVLDFLADTSSDKREAIIEKLIAGREFAEYRSLKWCDILRVKSEFPINLWPNAVQAYHRWIFQSFKENMPYDVFVRLFLTSSGSNFKVPQVNFYRAVQGNSPAAVSKAVALTFMGVRIERLPPSTAKGMEGFFSRVAYKSTREWKEEIVFLNPETSVSFQAVFPDGKVVVINPHDDPRTVFADWLVSPENPWFAKNIVNRVWSWIMGRGIIHEPDDIRDDNPASNPELLAYLEKELVESGFDLLHIYRLIFNSRAYQQSFIPASGDPSSAVFFAFYPARRLEAEVLADIFAVIGGEGHRYVSPIPEPFTVVPEYRRSVLLADGSITSPFLELFGRPPRDTGLESERNNDISQEQHLYLLNSTEMHRRISSSPSLQEIMVRTRRQPWDALIEEIYIFLLSRHPQPGESEKFREYFSRENISRREAAQDLVWVIINSREFLYRH